MELLEQLTDEFIAIYERSPARLKSKLSTTIKELSSNRSVNAPTKIVEYNQTFNEIEFL